ncbi:hypothetical protein FQA39_LY13643 [Lamprigera yunnana]|nr:hypothetical protein FQA39_LY13643 [Lamprigera yunnana]
MKAIIASVLITSLYIFLTLDVVQTQRKSKGCSEQFECVPISNCRELTEYIYYPCGTNSICCPPESFMASVRRPNITSRYSILPSECGLVLASNKITGGEISAVGQFPWMALLGYTQKGINVIQFLCGGSLISNEYILTAAHCTSLDSRLTLQVVRLGENDLEKREDCDVNGCNVYIDIPVSNFLSHEKFNKTSLENDVAIVKLKEKVTFTDFIQPICLPINDGIDYKPEVNKNLLVSGWGKTDSANIGGSSKLLYTTVEVWDLRKCNDSVPPNSRPIRDSQLCANGIKKQDACKGDSGGPLINSSVIRGDYRSYQIGIVSFATALTCGSVELPTVYTRVEYFMDWILSNVS